jgi:hypothetical protein
MSSNIFSFNIENFYLSSIKENYLNMKEEEAKPFDINSYLISIETRKNMINWLIFLCKTLNFTNQTLFHAISLFDKYLSKISLIELKEMTQNKLNLITIACLSLSTKLDEINCNYISFLNDKVLNTPNEKIFTNKDLTKMELTILKTLKYKTIYSTPIDFIDIYLEIFKKILGKNESFMTQQMISIIKNTSINILKDNVINENYLTNNASHFAYLCFIQSLNQISMMNSFCFKRLEKIILIFKYQFANIF